MRAPTTVLSGFSDESAWPLGCIKLELELVDDNDSTRTRVVHVEFRVMRSYSCYNALLRRVTLQKFGMVPSTVHGMIKFPTKQGIATIQMEFGRALCASVTPPKPLPTVEEQIQSSSILVNPKYPDKRIQIGGTLSDGIKVRLHDLLIANMDIFVWCENDMTGVPRHFANHKLHANPNLTPVRQKKRPMAPERSEWLRLEVDKLVHANILREVRYQTWVVNPVLVKKGTDLGACASILRTSIRRALISAKKFKCFLDAYKGYHQIHMVVGDEDKIAFHTD
ncbi:uncharacterized protein [Rutidosis leptorrhynchoides]|uniref:uncharacterized protein n=1 Tax=Rutidosis leptorrhynchoides TaxID=125765 RepID=UPI003A9A0C88